MFVSVEGGFRVFVGEKCCRVRAGNAVLVQVGSSSSQGSSSVSEAIRAEKCPKTEETVGDVFASFESV